MLVVTCPTCRVELDLEPADAGHLVECPACLGKFTAPGERVLASPPPPLPPPPPLSTPSGAVVVKCTACDGTVSVLSADLGHRLECPLCQKTFVPRDPTDRPSGRPKWRAEEEDRPSRRRRSSRYQDEDDDRYDDSPKAVVRRAQYKLGTPGGGLQVLGWIDVGAGVISLIIGIIMLAANGSSGGQEVVWGALSVGLGVSGVITGGLKALGGAAMKNARSRSLAVLAAIAGCIPLNINPCMVWLLFPTYILSIVFGIMALASLFTADVKKAFEINRPDGDTDALA